MGYYNTSMRYIDCPYYIRESEKEMTCQGTEEGTLTAHKFESEERKVLFQKDHCRYACERCHVAIEIKKIIGN